MVHSRFFSAKKQQKTLFVSLLILGNFAGILLAFVMEELEPQKKPYQIALVFFGKVSAWIIIPALAIAGAHYLLQNTAIKVYGILIVAVIAVSISFYGIYKESVQLIERKDI